MRSQKTCLQGIWGNVARWLFSAFFLCVLSSCASAKGISPAGGPEGAASPVPAAVTTGPSVDAKPLQTATTTATVETVVTYTPAAYVDLKIAPPDDLERGMAQYFANNFAEAPYFIGSDGFFYVEGIATDANNKETNGKYKIDTKSLKLHNFQTDDVMFDGNGQMNSSPNFLATVQATSEDGRTVTLIYDRASKTWHEPLDLMNKVPVIARDQISLAVKSFDLLIESGQIPLQPKGDGQFYIASVHAGNSSVDYGFASFVYIDPGRLEMTNQGVIMKLKDQDGTEKMIYSSLTVIKTDDPYNPFITILATNGTEVPAGSTEEAIKEITKSAQFEMQSPSTFKIYVYADESFKKAYSNPNFKLLLTSFYPAEYDGFWQGNRPGSDGPAAPSANKLPKPGDALAWIFGTRRIPIGPTTQSIYFIGSF